MATIVICHGAWDGGWYWQNVATQLRSRGHQVYNPSLTGLGERVHLGNPATDLETHIQDLVNLCVFEDLQKVVLVGHSYGGAVVTGVVDRIPERLSEVIYIDAFVPKNEESLVDLFGQSQVIDQLTGLANQLGNGWKIPFYSEGETDPRHVAHPLQTFYQKLNLNNPEAWTTFKKSYIACTERGQNPIYEPIEKCAQTAKAEGWPYYELATGHNANDTMPNELSDLLDQMIK